MNKKSHLLGLNFSTAGGQLRRSIMWNLIKETGRDICFRCHKKIEEIDDFTIDHKVPWQGSINPQETFFDLDNIAFSHHLCNSLAHRKDYESQPGICRQGHKITEENLRVTDRRIRCRECWNEIMINWRKRRKNGLLVQREDN